MAEGTNYNDVLQSFHTHPMTKHEFPEGLESAWFDSALAYYELDIEPLNYDRNEREFADVLPSHVVYTLGLIMYKEYLTRELSRVEKLVGFHGKDIQLTGSDEQKRITKADLELEIERVEILLHKQKTHAYN